MTVDLNLIVLVLMVGLILSGVLLTHNSDYGSWFLRLFNSRDTQVQLHLYFGMIAVFSILFYAGYAVVVRGFTFDIISLGKGIGATFAGVGLGSVGQGLQLKADGDMQLVPIDPTAQQSGIVGQVGPLFARLCDLRDSTMEMHLFLGAVAIISMILYTGYDLAYIAKDFQPFAYGQALAYTFAGVGAASWGQGVQRKLQQNSPTPPQKKD